MHIVNGTEHEINFFQREQCTRSEDGRKLYIKEGETPIYTVAAGKNLNCEKGNGFPPSGEYPFDVKGAVKFFRYDPIPEADLVIVSNLYRAAVVELGGDSSHLATIDSAVYQEGNPRPVGCIGLAVG